MLPLHVNVVPRLNWDACERVIVPELQTAWPFAREHLASVARLAMGDLQTPQLLLADLSENDVELMLRFTYCELAPTDHRVRGSVRVFTLKDKLDETGRKYRRRRIISVPDHFNALFDQAGEVSLPTPEECMNDLFWPCSMTGDFRAFYTQFPLPEEARMFYCFTALWKGEVRLFRMCCICTGQRQWRRV